MRWDGLFRGVKSGTGTGALHVTRYPELSGYLKEACDRVCKKDLAFLKLLYKIFL